jgi:D-alanyl-D-alanine carboxypeptidase
MLTKKKATACIAKRIIIALLVGALALTGCGQAAPTSSRTAVPTNTPTAVPSPTTALVAAPALEVDTGPGRVEPFLDKAYKANLFTGVALIARDGKIIFSKAWGMADREKNVPNTPQTIFRVGENTMQFTAAAILLLEQEGKLSVQDPICNYLDNCPEAWKAITIHHLLSSSSGIPEYLDLVGKKVYKAGWEGATPQQLVATFRNLPLAFKPGAQRVWSRSDFVLAGLIIERASGQPYGDFIKQSVFEPLGMTRSGYGDPPERLALGYLNATSKSPATFNVSALYAAGGCYSTAEDLFRWNEGLYNGRLLNETELKKMLTPHFTLKTGNGTGYGIVLFDLAGRKAAGYVGGPDGYTSATSRYFDDRVTSLVIGNQNMSSIVRVIDEMEKLYFGVE